MSRFNRIFSVALLIASIGANGQEISVEEMQLLDKLRLQFQEKGIQLKPEDEIRYLQRIRAMRGLATSINNGLAASAAFAPAQPQAAPPTQSAAPAESSVAAQPSQAQPTQSSTVVAQPLVNGPPTEEGLRAKLTNLVSGNPLNSLVLLRDGLQFNGQRFADPEGIARSFSVDPDSAMAGYLVKTDTAANVKIARLGSPSDPVTIGRLTQEDNRFRFQSVTGKSLSGDLIFPLTDGILVVRDSVGFRYVVGDGVHQIDIPAGWVPAPLQRGNVSTTGWFLLEKEVSQEKESPLSSLLAIGSLLGAGPARKDYALFNLNDRRMVLLEVSADGKTVATYSQCRRMPNGLINKCDQMRTYESVWKPDGTPNRSHYFWAIDWQNMNGKPVAVVMERGLKQVNAFDLTGTKRVNLLERAMGINNWSMTLTDGGKYRIDAQLAFEKVAINDVASELQSRSPLDGN